MAWDREHVRGLAFGSLLLAFATFVGGHDLPARAAPRAPMAIDTPLTVAARQTRTVAWVSTLPPVVVKNGASRVQEELRLYAPEGEVDADAKARFESLVARDEPPHALSERVIKLLFKAAYHFGRRAGAATPPTVTVVSAWREHAGRHSTGEAIDFKLAKVPAAQLAAYLRGLPRVGVGIYTHPRTQYVHLDVREESYHWLDASPPGVRWRERQLRDAGRGKRDASYAPSGDLPLE